MIHPLSPEGAIDLAAIRTPARIISGTADQVVRESLQAAPLAAALPNATHERVEGAGHMLHRSHADLVVAAVREVVGGMG